MSVAPAPEADQVRLDPEERADELRRWWIRR